jgi:hypothetical protein
MCGTMHMKRSRIVTDTLVSDLRKGLRGGWTTGRLKSRRMQGVCALFCGVRTGSTPLIGQGFPFPLFLQVFDAGDSFFRVYKDPDRLRTVSPYSHCNNT